jgi:hypothetical protein
MVGSRLSIKAFKVGRFFLSNSCNDAICWLMAEKSEKRSDPMMSTRSKNFSNSSIKGIIDEVTGHRTKNR